MSAMELGWGLDIILWFQSWRSPLVESLGQVFHLLGYTEFYLIVLSLIYWCIDAPAGRRFGLLLIPAIWLNSTLKDWWQRPRPFMISDAVRPTISETTYGLPSGHAQGSTALGGAVAIESHRWWVTTLVALFVILMGISRMAVGVHYPQDVIVGMLISLVLVGLYAQFEPPFSRWVNNQSLWTQLWLVVGITVVAAAVHPVLIKVSTPQWMGFTLPHNELISAPTMLIVTFFALGIGFALEVHFVGFSAGGSGWQRSFRYVVGMLGVLILRYGLGVLSYPFQGQNISLTIRLVETGLIGLWLSFVAPWIFVKFRLADRMTASDSITET